jgi:hypothetical protein
MPSKSKAKGNRFEKLVEQMSIDAGITAKRAWGSNGAALGHHEEVDVLLNNKIKIQCKVRKKIADWMMPSEHVDIQLIKEDRGIPYVVMPYDDYLELIKENE